MKIINFLPDDYVEKRGRRQANHVCLIIGGGALLIVASLVGFTLLRAARVAQTRAIVEKQYLEASKRIDTLKELENRKEGLLRKVELSTDLIERVPRSTILARLTNALPPKTWIQLLSMATKEVKVAAQGPDPRAAKEAPAKGAGPNQAAPRPKTTSVIQTEFILDGLAETDVQVAEYITRLSADPFFGELNLRFSEEFPLAEGLTVRRFEIVFRLTAEAAKLLEATPGARPHAAARPAPSPATRGDS